MRTTKRLQGKGAIIYLFLQFLFMLSLSAQTKVVNGRVTDSQTNEPISGVSVIVKGTKTGTVTDAAGKFNLNINGRVTLVFSSIGFEKKELTTDGTSAIEIELVNTNGSLSDVVVVGYGRQKKTTLTGAVEIVSSKTFQDRAVTNVGLALQGASPSLIVTRSSPRPGNEGIDLLIRGATSANGSKPLIIVDGSPVLNDYSFLNMNADDIESISVLKDASASIYGSAASNGVILVTTKRGKGKVKIDFSSNIRFNTNGITGYSPSMKEYASMWLEANKEEINPNWWVWGNKSNLEKMQSGYEGVYNFSTWPGVDYFIFNANRIDEMFSTRYSYQNNISLSGGNEKSSYRLSMGMADNQGNLATAYDGQKQYNARFNYDIKINEKLKLETGISVVNAKTSTPSSGLDATLFGNDMPFFPAKNPFGQWFACFNGVDGGANRNAAARTSDGGRSNRNSLTENFSIKGIYKITKDLSVEGLASIQGEQFNADAYYLAVPVYNWYGKQTGWAGGLDTTKTSYTTSTWFSSRQYYNLLLRYSKLINNMHSFAAVAGIDANKYKYKTYSANRTLFNDLGVQDISLATGVQTVGGFSSQIGSYAYLARFNYAYADKYLLELQGRIDGSSRFAPGHKFQNYGGASVGWVFTNEKFLEAITPVVSFGKLRVSYGTSGNQASGLGEFDYLGQVNVSTSYLGNPVTAQSAAYYNALISNNRTWEKVVQKNIALDVNFLKNRLSTTFEYFNKDNIGMLIPVTYPSVLGGIPPFTNNGHFSTKGWEAIVKWSDRKKDFAYNIGINISDTKTKVTGLENGNNFVAGRNNMVNGYAFRPWFVYRTDGYFKDQAEVDAYYAKYGSSGNLLAYPQSNLGVALRPGDTKKVDVSGVGSITGSGNEKSSLVYAGDGTPHYTFGINMGASWKGFDFSAFFQGQLKQLIMRSGWMAYPYAAIYTNQNPSFLGKTWTSEKTDAVYPRLTVNPSRANWNYVNNDFMLQNNRYMRLKTLVVGYSLPESLIRKVKLEKVRIYFSGNDLWELVNIKDGFDPEMGETSQNSGYPFARTWSFGINVGL